MDDAINLLLTASGSEDTEANRALARAIVEELGRLPLALAQAAGYIFVHKCLSTYLILYRQSTKMLLATSRVGSLTALTGVDIRTLDRCQKPAFTHKIS